MTKFTEKQIKDWRDFENVRASGVYNMFDNRAREATGLTKEEYFFVMENFSELKSLQPESTK